MHASWTRRCAAIASATAAAALALPAVPAVAGTGGLTVTPLTWNVIGLDSNKVTAGPDGFPVGARVCATGADATDVTADFVWDSSNANINLSTPASVDIGDLATGACADAYFTVTITRAAAAYDTTRGYHISASNGTVSGSTPVNRELYVEHLVSQNRNAVDGVSGSAINASGNATVYVGSTYVFHVDSHTAPGGYEQLENVVTFPSMFRLLGVSMTYGEPVGATNTSMYADACGWDNDRTSATYRSCVGPTTYGGKAGGSPIGADYTVLVVGTGSGSINNLIYDFSGSSFHYNSDFGTAAQSVTFNALTPVVPPATPAAVDDTASTTAPDPVTVDVLTNDDLGTTPTTVTGNTQGGNGSVSCTTTDCTYTPDAGFDGTDTFTYTITDDNGATSTATVTVTVAPAVVILPPVVTPPTADDDTASTTGPGPVTIAVLGNDTGGAGATVVTGHSSPGHGTVTCTTTSCTYTPDAGYSGADSFTYTITDGNGSTATAVVWLTVTPAPAAPPTAAPGPAATDDTTTAPTGSPVVISVLGNDTLGATPVTITSYTPPGHGTVACTDTTCTYVPDPGYVGPDTFTYTLTDAAGHTSTATVTVTVLAGGFTAPATHPQPTHHATRGNVRRVPVVVPPKSGPARPVVREAHPGRLPFTGADSTAMVTVALTFVLTGAVLTRLSRRRRPRRVALRGATK